MALAEGAAVVVPNPAPMAYGVVATTARAVNAVKGRPLEQNVGVSVHDRSLWQDVAAALDIPPAAIDSVAALLRRRLTVLAPVNDYAAGLEWTVPAIRDGQLAMFDGRWAATADLWERFPLLYGSSANRTGAPPVSNAHDAREEFGEECAVIDVVERDAPGERWSSTMVRVDEAAGLEMHRSGAQDRSSGLTPDDFIRHIVATVGLKPG